MAVQIILASASPRRKELLERLGFTVKVIPANIDEIRLEGETPENYVKRMSRTKTLSVVDRLQTTLYPTDVDGSPIRTTNLVGKGSDSRWVICADTIVVVGDDVRLCIHQHVRLH